MSRWETLDLAAMLKQETAGATTSANAGAYAVPLGARPIKRYPVGAQDAYARRREDEDAYGAGYQSYDQWLLPSKV